MIKRVFLLASCLLCAVFLAACSSKDDGDSGGGGGGGEEPIVLGFAVSETGGFNAFDAPFLAGAEVAIEEINADGGVDGRPFKVVTADNKSDLSQVVPAALQVIEQGADIVFTTCDYDYGAPAARTANEEGLLAIGCAGSPQFGAQGVGDLTFNTLQPSNVEAATMAQYAFNEKGWKSAYLLEDTSIDYSKSVCRFFEEAWTKLGGEVAGKVTFTNSDTSISAQVDRMRGSDADVIVLCSYLPGGPTAAKQIRGGGIDTPIMGSVGFDVTGALDSIPDLTDFYNPTNGLISSPGGRPEHTEFGKAFRELHGEIPGTEWSAIVGYTAIEMLAKAIESAGGSTDGADLKAELEKFEDEELLAGPTTYTEGCHIPVTRPYGISSYVNGEREIAESSYPVDPESVPEAPC